MIEAAMEDFVSQLRQHVDGLRAKFHVDDPLAGRSEGNVPRRGVIDGVPFLFHGRGLRFELESRLVDVDFCEDGVEVDWWRFQQFLAPIEDRSSVVGLRDVFLAALPAANARRTSIGTRLLIWRE